MANAVYDPDTEGEQQYHPPNPDPLDNKAAGDPSDPRTIHKKSADDKIDGEAPRSDIRDAEKSGDSLYNPHDEQEPGDSSERGLSTREKDGGAGAGAGFKFSESDKGGRFQSALKMAAKHKKGIGIGVGAGGGVAAIALSVFLMLIPLKIEHIVQNLEHRFFASSENAVDSESRKMFTRYMTKHVLPGYRGKCGTTIDKGCSPVGLGGNNPVTRMYKSWANARLENKLAENYGIEFKYDTQSKNWYMKAPGTSPNGDNIGPDGGGLDTDFERHDRAGLRSAVSDAFEHETRWKKVMYRYKVGRLLEEKYGLKRCIIFCGARDQLADKKDAKLKAAKLYLVQRVITPRFQTLGTVMECLIQGCDPTKTQPISAEDGTTGELAGSPENPETDSKIRQDGVSIASKFVGESSDDMLSALKTIQEKGYKQYLLEKILEKIGLKELSSNISDAAPIVGWANRAATVITWINNAGPALKKLGYIANAGAAVKLYMMYRTYADEIHTGHVDATEAGSLTTSFSPGDRGTSTDPQIGGTAGAEGSPLYQNVVDKNSGTAVAFDNLLPVKAYAASSGGSSDYKCSGNKPVPAGKLVCPEEVLGGGNSFFDGVHSTLNTAPLSYITQLASAWHGIVGGILGAVGGIFGSVLNSIPGVSSLVNSLTSFIANIVQPFFSFLTDKLLPSPWSTSMSGARTFDLTAAGSDVSGNDYAHTGLGGKQLNPQQVADIVNQQEDQSRRQFESQPFFARMFDTSSDYSLITKVAMSIPLGTQADAQKGLATLSNPLKALTNGFASLFSGRAIAAATAQPDPFGVVQYGYTADDLNKIGDPETYWNNNCSDNAAYGYSKNNNWNEAAAHYNTQSSDDPSGMPVNTTTNPCLLIKGTVGSAGGMFDTSNLTSDDLADLSNSGGSTGPTTPAPSGDYTNPFPGGWAPNRLDMGYDGTFKGQIVAPFSGTITYAGPFNGWRTSSGVIIQADKDLGLATKSLYFTEGVAPITSLQGKHVDVGTPIANATASPYGAYSGQSTAVGAIEWGLAQDGSIGHQTDTEAIGMGTCSAAAKTMVLNFSQWVVNTLHVAKYDTSLSDNNPGCP